MEITERFHQLLIEKVTTLRVVTPVKIKFCIDAEWIMSYFYLSFVKSVLAYKELDDSTLQTYFNKKAVASKIAVIVTMLDKIHKN